MDSKHVHQLHADPTIEIDQRAKELLREGGAKSYSAAIYAVLAEDTELRKMYAAWSAGCRSYA